MPILRFFLMCPSPTTRPRCAPARRYIRVLTRAPRPLSLPSANTPTAFCNTADGLDRLFRFPTRRPVAPQTALQIPYRTASAANTSGFLLVCSSKTPRIQFYLVVKVSCPRRFRSSLATIRQPTVKLAIAVIDEPASKIMHQPKRARIESR
jgi:hypothetical protein